MLSPGCRSVTPSSSGSDSRVKQRRGNIKPQGWGTGACHQGGVSGRTGDVLQGFPTFLDKARPKTGIFGSRTCISAAGVWRGSLGAVINLGLSSHRRGGARQLLLALWGLQNFPPTCRVLQCQGIRTKALSQRTWLPWCCHSPLCGPVGLPYWQHTPACWASLQNSSWAGG